MPAPKSRSISVWLLKPGFDVDSALVANHTLDGPVAASGVPASGALYIHDASPRPPWWRDYLGVTRDLAQSLKSALLFVPAGNRVCVVTFGNTAHNLRPESYEYDFGLMITLNCVDPSKLRNTDTADPGAARRQRTQTAVGSDITFFDVENDSHVLRSLTGAAKAEYSDVLKSVTGAAQVRFSTAAPANELSGLCVRLVELYEKDDYKTAFPDVRNVRPVKDPAIVAALNESLVVALRRKSDDPQLAIPEIVDFTDARFVRFSGDGHGDLYEDLTLDAYFEYLRQKKIKRKTIEYSDLARHRVLVLDENEQQRSSYALSRCFVFDTRIAGRQEHFHLIDGSWFALEKSYVRRIQRELKPLFIDEKMPPASSGHEADYNLLLSQKLGGACLDKTSISPRGLTQVEPCDVLSFEGGAAVFSHVKMGTGSAELSHLFYQGQNATTLILTEPDALAVLENLIEAHSPDSATSASLAAAARAGQLRVRFAIVTRKPADGGLANLPLFSQLSLARAARVFRALRIELSVVFVDDIRPPAAAKPKTRKARAAGPVFS